MSAWWPIFTPPCTLSTEMNRANTCASVMNSRVLESSFTTSGIALVALRAVSTKFAWVRKQPFGLPIVPDV